MSGTSRRKGNVAESQLARWLRDHGHPEARTTRDARGGSQGGADIVGVKGWDIEVKNCARLDVPGWWRQTLDETVYPNEPALVIKPAGVRDPGRWVVVTVDRAPVGAPRVQPGAKPAAVVAARCVIEEDMWWCPAFGEPLMVTTVADLWGWSE